MKNPIGLKGIAVISLFDEEMALKHRQTVYNLITTNGDLYYATRSAAGVLPAAIADITKANGMKLGTGTTLPTKSGVGSALITYTTGSNQPFTTSFPTVTPVGTDIGYNLLYYAIWAPTVATNSALSEAVIINDSASNATSTAANTVARITFTPINKQAGDTLEISWSHTFIGA